MLNANPVVDEIRRLHDGRETGILTLSKNGSERIDIFFREGIIEAAWSNLDEHRLGHYLVRDGYLTPRDIEVIRSEAKRQHMVFGEVVVNQRMSDQAAIRTAVRNQAMNLIEHALKNGFEVESFTSSLKSYCIPAGLGFPQVLLGLCRTCAAQFEDKSTRLVLSNSIDLSVFPWYPQELSLLSELRYPSTFEELLKRTKMPESNLKRILGVLDLLGVLENVEESEPHPDGGPLVRESEFAFEDLIPVVTNAVLNEKLEVARNETSFTSEQFKNLKVQIAEANVKGPMKVITVSSPDAQDGKSLISANLAFSFALDPGRRVIVVDCDLRNPALDQYLGVPSEPGLLQYLADGQMSPYCYVRRVENLYFLTAGGLASNPIEILSMKRVKQLIERLRRDFDTIIIDAPPYAPISDARIVTGLSDALVMVVRRGKTSYSSMDRAITAIDRNKLLGVVFNDVKPMLFHTYHNFGYYYGGKDSVYGKAPRVPSGPKNYLES